MSISKKLGLAVSASKKLTLAAAKSTAATVSDELDRLPFYVRSTLWGMSSSDFRDIAARGGNVRPQTVAIPLVLDAVADIVELKTGSRTSFFSAMTADEFIAKMTESNINAWNAMADRMDEQGIARLPNLVEQVRHPIKSLKAVLSVVAVAVA